MSYKYHEYIGFKLHKHLIKVTLFCSGKGLQKQSLFVKGGTDLLLADMQVDRALKDGLSIVLCPQNLHKFEQFL